MILGIGCDICNIARIEKIIEKRKDAFLKKIFHNNEIIALSKKTTLAASVAKLFSAKEAVVKSIGITKGVSLCEIEITKNTNGKPYVVLHGKTKKIANSCAEQRNYEIQISISDDYPFATAYAIFQVIA